MHPQLSERKLVCKEFMEALDACHSNNWARLFGFCNAQKDALNACLRKERIERATENRQIAQERKLKTEQARKKFYDDSQ